VSGGPKIARNLRELVVRFAKENAGWGYRRIIGELRKLRLRIGRSLVRRILKDEGLTPSPTRRGRAEETVGRKFIRLHVNTLVAGDLFTKHVITPLGVRLAYGNPKKTGIADWKRNVVRRAAVVYGQTLATRYGPTRRKSE
jgi:putative transposase